MFQYVSIVRRRALYSTFCSASSLSDSLVLPIVHHHSLRRPWHSTGFHTFTMAKRKRSSGVGVTTPSPAPLSIPIDVVATASTMMPPWPIRRASTRKISQPEPADIDTNPDTNPRVEDAQEALRASPDADEPGEKFEAEKVTSKKPRKTAAKKSATPTMPKPKAKAPPSDSSLSDLSDVEEPNSLAPSTNTTPAAKKTTAKPAEIRDPEADEEEDADPEEISAALSRPPPVNSSYLPLPWKGRLGYACLCTYLRASNPPVFSSRTCRIASILEHRHPLTDPSQPEHATKNRPDKEQPAEIARGQAYV